MKKIKLMRIGVLAYALTLTILYIMSVVHFDKELTRLKHDIQVKPEMVDFEPEPTETPAPTVEAHTVEFREPFTVTAYCACKNCCGKDETDTNYGITSTGTLATSGRTVAVDPTVIPYGSIVMIDGHEYIAEDTGGAIEGKRVDIFFDNHSEAKAYGRRVKEVTVLSGV